MPAGDGSGPRGEGPLTGRAMGRCSGYPVGRYTTAPGRGRGMRNRYYEARRRGYPPYDIRAINQECSETESLRSQVQFVADTIEQIAYRISQLLKRKTDKE